MVTGAGGGLGTAIVQRLAGMGAQVVMVDLKAPPQPPGATGTFSLACDIADPQAVAAMGQEVERRFGRCDILVNNAGVKAIPVPLEEFRVEDWDRIFGVNVRGAFLCARAVVKMMLASGSGAIVNIASIGATLPTRVGAYGPSKAAICGLTRQMAVEWGRRGVRANSISPGFVRTPMSDGFYKDEQQLTLRLAMLPLAKIGVPHEVADAVAYLASDASSFITGQDLVVDGGFTLAPLFNAQPQDVAARAAAAHAAAHST